MGLLLYEAPDAAVGDLPLRGPGVSLVLAHDLRQIREVAGLPIMGILGMDFLGRYVLRIDRDRGELRLLDSTPPDAGEALPITSFERGVPTITASVGDSGAIRFLIDTGMWGTTTGRLDETDGPKLLAEKQVRIVGSGLSMTVAGSVTAQDVRADGLTLGRFRIDQPALRLGGRAGNLLGLNFWSRFVVTFDFPGRKVYLRKGAGYDRPDVLDRSGLHLLKREGRVIAEIVDVGRPAAAAGVAARRRSLRKWRVVRPPVVSYWTFEIGCANRGGSSAA